MLKTRYRRHRVASNGQQNIHNGKVNEKYFCWAQLSVTEAEYEECATIPHNCQEACETSKIKT